MPIPPELLLASGQVLSGGLNVAATNAQNRNSMLWSELMYEKTKRDNLQFWNMVNEYNAPKQQMARLKEAGLNPMLVYGGSSGGTAGQGGSIPTPDVQAPQWRTPDFDFVGGATSSAINAIYDLEIKQAQVDNLRADNTVKLEEAALKSAQRANTEQGTKRSLFDLELDSELRDISAEARRENLRKLKADIQFTLDSNERAAASTSQSLQEGAERVLSMRLERARTKEEISRIQALKAGIYSDNRLKELDIALRKNGIMPSDPIWARALGQYLGGNASIPGQFNKFSKSPRFNMGFFNWLKK